MGRQKTISVSEYARLVGCDRKEIYRAIERGKIPANAVQYDSKNRPSIIPSLANEAWGNQYLEKKEKTEVNTSTITTDDEGLPVITRDMSRNEAARANEILEAMERKLKVRKQTGELVEKKAVYDALVNKGMEDRARFENIPERCIDDVLAANSRQKAYQILVKAISEALEGAATLPKIKES